MQKIHNQIKIIKRTPFLSLQNKRIQKLIKVNREFYNIYFGKRLFIVANGPSIKNENLDLLKGEYVFTVNQMIRKAEFVSLNPIANFWFDPAYFDDTMPNDSKSEFQELFRKTCELNNSIISFVPVSAYEYLNKNNLVTDKVKFLDTCLYFYDGYNANIDFSKCSAGFQNIVQFAIAMGIYMGFAEIYLLGVDSTGIITKINQVLDQSIEDCYTYNLGESGEKYVNSLLNYFSVEEQFAGWTRIFHLYKELYKYCTNRNIKLVNCSSQTIIEGIPQIPLERVVENAKSV